MKLSSCAKFLSLGLIASAASLVPGFSADSAPRFTAPSSTQVDFAAVEFKEFREGTEAVSAIPKSAIIREDGKTYVFAQTDPESSVFERWEVTLGYGQDDNYVEALTGVFPGDNVAISGLEKFTLQSASMLSKENRNRVVSPDGKGIIVRAPSKPVTQPKATARPIPSSRTSQSNQFGYQREERADSRFDESVTRYPRYSNSRYEDYPVASSCDLSNQFECNGAPCENYDYVPSFTPSCDVPQRGYSYDVSPGYCPNDGYGYWGH